MPRILSVVLATALVIGVAGAGYLALRACGLRETFLMEWLPGSCPSAGALAARAEIETLRAEGLELVRRIAATETDIARIRCTAEAAAAPAPSEAPPTVAEPAAIDEDAWRARDLGILAGCWRLDSRYRVQNRETGLVTEFDAWTMCFDEAGRGRATMRSPAGSSCEGEVGGLFDDAGRLAFDEPAGLRCDDGTQVFRRILACSLAGDGSATCAESQPELGWTGTVRLRRAIEGQP